MTTIETPIYNEIFSINGMGLADNKAREELNNIKDGISQRDNEITENTKNIQQLELRMSSIETNVISQNTAISKVVETSENHVVEIRSLKQSDEVITENVGDNSIEISALKTKNTQQDSRMKTIEDTATAQAGEITALKTKDSQHETRMSQIESKNSSQDTEINNLKTKDTQQDSRMKTIEDTATAQAGEISDLKSKDVQHETRMSQIESKNSSQDTEISNIKTKNSSQDTEISNLKTKDTQQDSRMKTIEDTATAQAGEITALKTKDSQHETRMSQIESKNNSQDTEINTLKSKVNVPIKNFTLKAGITPNSSSYYNYIKEVDKITISCMLDLTTDITGETALFTMGAGDYPSKAKQVQCWVGNETDNKAGSGVVYIPTTGDVIMKPSGTWNITKVLITAVIIL